MVAARSYEPNRDLIVAVSNTFGGTLVSAFDYTNDALGRRTARVDAQPALDPVQNVFGYNARSEVNSALMGTNTYGYAYDPIGNRLVATNNAVATAYLANELNQYTNVLRASAPPREDTPTHDADGNLLSNGAWSFAWDGENRLLSASNATTLVTYVHDYRSRRVRRKQYTWDADCWSLATDQRFLYDGWALIREVADSASGAVTNHFVYGLDLSGSLQGAGTVGGILSANLNGTTVFYGYDSNGNVTDLVDTNGTLAAHYEYDAFGRTIAQSGDLAATFAHRFSTKYRDPDIGLYYYGYRYYSPELGRWVSRDPIGERGGRSLYPIAENSVIGAIDYLGFVKLSNPPTDEELQGLRETLISELTQKEYGLTPQAAKAMLHWIEASGETHDFGYEFFYNSTAGKKALERNRERIERAIKDFVLHELEDGETKRLLDYWDAQESSKAIHFDYDFKIAVGGFTLTSYLAGTGSRDENGCFKFTGTVDHLFWDYYDFNAGSVFPWGGTIGELPCDYLILMNNKGLASNMWTKGEASQKVSATGEDGFLWGYTFSVEFGELGWGLGGSNEEVIAAFPKARRMVTPPPPRGGKDP